MALHDHWANHQAPQQAVWRLVEGQWLLAMPALQCKVQELQCKPGQLAVLFACLGHPLTSQNMTSSTW